MDGWYLVAEFTDTLLIATWHYEEDNNGYPEGDPKTTYTVVDRSKQYAPTSSRRYATEIFIFACIKELLTKLDKLPITGKSERLARLKKFVRKEKGLVKGQEARDEEEDFLDEITGNFDFSPFEGEE